MSHRGISERSIPGQGDRQVPRPGGLRNSRETGWRDEGWRGKGVNSEDKSEKPWGPLGKQSARFPRRSVSCS